MDVDEKVPDCLGCEGFTDEGQWLCWKCNLCNVLDLKKSNSKNNAFKSRCGTNNSHICPYSIIRASECLHGETPPLCLVVLDLKGPLYPDPSDWHHFLIVMSESCAKPGVSGRSLYTAFNTYYFFILAAVLLCNCKDTEQVQHSGSLRYKQTQLQHCFPATIHVWEALYFWSYWGKLYFYHWISVVYLSFKQHSSKSLLIRLNVITLDVQNQDVLLLLLMYCNTKAFLIYSV